MNRKNSIRIGTVVTGFAALALVGSGSAFALGGTHVTVGGSATPAGNVSVTGTNSNDIVFMTDAGVEMRCADSDITGKIVRGALVETPTKVGQIDTLSFTSCTATSLLIPVTVTMNTGDFTVRTTPAAAGDPVAVTIDVNSAHIEESSGTKPCEMDASGTVDAIINPAATGNDGEVELVSAQFDSSGFPVSGFDLDITTPGGLDTCGGEIHDGDHAGAFYSDEGTQETSKFDLFTVGNLGDISHS